MSKYCRKYHPKLAPVHPSHSRVWKNLHKVRDAAEEQIHWQIGDGSCDFWLDSWMELGPLVHYYPENRGAFEEGRQHRPGLVISYELWHNNIPKKMSFLAWRLWNGWLAVDEILMKRGIPLASKCHCCEQMETLEHVFFTNPIADQVWAHYAALVGIRHVRINSLQQVIAAWSLSVSTKGHIKQVLPIVILWALWEGRNKAKHIAATYSFHQICSRVHNLLFDNSKANMNHTKFWTGESYLGAILGVTVEVKPQPAPRLFRWDRPEKSTLKLNIDATFKENRAG
ncbi:hypothetical protein LIER_22018 [Lithospermum erythrorhizon]|uniref:Reverse transcriptase zinc-binding domain-containing protein n=1 Tax=Lithospermum erythrorhizon TaxID=34254 RepID=A0AAV3QSB0_LITER